METVAEDDGSNDVEAEQRALLRRVEVISLSLSKNRVELLIGVYTSVQVAFSHGVASTPLRTFGKPRERIKDKSEAGDAEDVAFDNGRISFTSPSTDKTEVEETYADSTNAGIKKKKKEYMEPWDYEHSNYPVTLPLRRPYSGDPELLDEAEFEEGAEYDENTICSAKDLGLLDQDANQKEILGRSFPSAPLSADAKGKQIAGSLPSVSAGAKGKGISGSPTNQGSGYFSRKKISLEELPKGYMGKMQVYKSGTVKLNLGDIHPV